MTRVTRPFDRVLKRIRQEIEHPQADPAVVEALAEIGRQAIRAAAESKQTGNITFNQMESFGWAVYFGGEAQRQGYLDHARYRSEHRNRAGNYVKGAEPDPKRHKYGRSQALHAIRGHKPTTDRYELYLVNAMWYTSAHESRGLHVLTQEIASAIDAISQLFNVDVFCDFKNFDWY